MLFSITDDYEQKETLYFNKYENDFYQHTSRENEWLRNARKLKLDLVSHLRDKKESDSDTSQEKKKTKVDDKKPNIHIEEHLSFDKFAEEMQ